MIDITSLLATSTADQLLTAALDLAASVDLPVTSWRPGDPTLTGYQYLARKLATLDGLIVDAIKSRFLTYARGDFLKLIAVEVYGVTPVESEPSTPTVTLTNGGGGVYEMDPGDVTVKASSSGATFHNTGIVAGSSPLLPGASITLQLVADVAGSDGTVATNEIDSMVTTFLGVTVTSSAASIGLDEQSEDSIKQDCLDTRGALSPDGPPDAYEFVARRPELTGVATVNRSKSSSDSDTGLVTVWIAGPSGPVDGATVTAVQAAIDVWAEPLTTVATVVSASAVTIDIDAEISGVDVPADFEALITSAVGVLLSACAIASDDGDTVARSRIITAIHNKIPLTNVNLITPAADVPYAAGQVPAIGSVSVMEV